MEDVQKLLVQLEEEQTKKWDDTVDVRRIRMGEDGKLLVPLNEETHNRAKSVSDVTDDRFGLTKSGHEQLGNRLDIPPRYYNRMRDESPGLLAKNVNHWMEREQERKFFVRGMGGDVRAIMSERYRVIDHVDFLKCALTELQDKDSQIETWHLNEKHLFVKLTSSQLKSYIRHVADVIVGGVILSNSETGHGAVRVQPRLYRVQCLNGMVIEEAETTQVHLGRGHGGLIESDSVYMKVRQSIRTIFDQFGNIVNQLKDTTEMHLQNVQLAIQNVVDQYQMTDEQKNNILVAFGAEPEETRYGLLNAVTRAAQKEEDYERALEMEKVGGELITMQPEKFTALVTAA